MAARSDNTEEYRLKQWEGIIRDRQVSGLSVKAFCEKAGYHPNKFYYWQRKMRERSSLEQNNGAGEAAPSGWAVCNVTESAVLDSSLNIQIGRYQVNISGMVDAHQLEAVYRMIPSHCFRRYSSVLLLLAAMFFPDYAGPKRTA